MAPAAVPAAVGLTIVSVMMLILHIHLLAGSMLSKTIIELVGRELDAELEPLGDTPDEEDPDLVLPDGLKQHARLVGVSRQGYVQAIEYTELVEIAREADLIVAFRFRAGDYMIARGRRIALYPAERATPLVERRVARAFTTGAHRTAGAGYRVLNSAPRRGGGPGPLARRERSIDRRRCRRPPLRIPSRLMAVRMPPGVFRDWAGEVRVVCERPTHASLVSAAFDQIRQSGADKPLVLMRLAQAVGRIADAIMPPEQVDLLRDELRLIDEAAERRIEMADDRAAVARRVQDAREALDDAERRGLLGKAAAGAA